MAFPVFRFHSARRAGHHAIMRWLAAHLDNEVLHLNDLMVESNGNPVKIEDNQVVLADDSYLRTFDEPIFYHEQKKVRSIFLNFEDQPPAIVIAPPKKMPTPEDWPVQDIVVLRDPLNLIASRVQMYRKQHHPVYASEVAIQNYILWSEILAQGSALSEKFTVINYNQWFLSKEYRQGIIEAFDLPFTDAGREEVSQSGQGSSFDGLNFDGAASQMKVLERYKATEEDEIYQSIVNSFQDEFQKIFQTFFRDLVPYDQVPRYS